MEIPDNTRFYQYLRDASGLKSEKSRFLFAMPLLFLFFFFFTCLLEYVFNSQFVHISNLNFKENVLPWHSKRYIFREDGTMYAPLAK